MNEKETDGGCNLTKMKWWKEDSILFKPLRLLYQFLFKKVMFYPVISTLNSIYSREKFRLLAISVSKKLTKAFTL